MFSSESQALIDVVDAGIYIRSGLSRREFPTAGGRSAADRAVQFLGSNVNAVWVDWTVGV
jgi:hypothetical protein